MKKVFDSNNINLNKSFSNKEEAIKAAGKVLLENGYVKEEYINDMLEREKSTTTYIGNHIAIPHGTDGSKKNIIKSGISLIQVPQGVSFGEDKIAHVIIGIASKDGEHLEMLRKIALICLEIENVEKLKTAKKTKEILKIFQDFNN